MPVPVFGFDCVPIPVPVFGFDCVPIPVPVFGFDCVPIPVPIFGLDGAVVVPVPVPVFGLGGAVIGLLVEVEGGLVLIGVFPLPLFIPSNLLTKVPVFPGFIVLVPLLGLFVLDVTGFFIAEPVVPVTGFFIVELFTGFFIVELFTGFFIGELIGFFPIPTLGETGLNPPVLPTNIPPGFNDGLGGFVVGTFIIALTSFTSGKFCIPIPVTPTKAVAIATLFKNFFLLESTSLSCFTFV